MGINKKNIKNLGKIPIKEKIRAYKIQNKGFWKGCLYKLYLRSLKGFKINNTKLRRLKRENI